MIEDFLRNEPQWTTVNLVQ